MKGIKETDLKRIFDEAMFNEFLKYMKGKTYAKIDNEPVYYSSNVGSFVIYFFRSPISQITYSKKVKNLLVEIEV